MKWCDFLGDLSDKDYEKEERDKAFDKWITLVESYISNTPEEFALIYERTTGYLCFPLKIARWRPRNADVDRHRFYYAENEYDMCSYVHIDIDKEKKRVYFYCPEKIKYDFTDTSQWPWKIDQVDWMGLGKNVWSVIVNNITSLEDRTSLCLLNRAFGIWMQDDMFWKAFRTFIDTRFLIYTQRRVVDVLDTVYSFFRKSTSNSFLDFVFCNIFSDLIVQKHVDFLKECNDEKHIIKKYKIDMYIVAICIIKQTQQIDVFIDDSGNEKSVCNSGNRLLSFGSYSCQYIVNSFFLTTQGVFDFNAKKEKVKEFTDYCSSLEQTNKRIKRN